MNGLRTGAWLYWIGGLAAAFGLVVAVLSPLIAKLAIDRDLASAPVVSPHDLRGPARLLLLCLFVGMGLFALGLTVLIVGYRQMRRDRSSSDDASAETWSG